MELKKRIQNTAVRREEAKKDNRPLFEKYQFFTPGWSPQRTLSIKPAQSDPVFRHLHGYNRRYHHLQHPRRRPEGPLQPRGVIRCLHQGHGTRCPEEAAISAQLHWPLRDSGGYRCSVFLHARQPSWSSGLYSFPCFNLSSWSERHATVDLTWWQGGWTP